MPGWVGAGTGGGDGARLPKRNASDPCAGMAGDGWTRIGKRQGSAPPESKKPGRRTDKLPRREPEHTP
ncbi:hypothetical protein GCM10009687_81690 [Asanoa iriomotensis]|uniref:Uncharacterized protein n=1 Tax=Asanoa iriomotensis TaxID=234613 RepID=A0ABQ4CEB3_9ACTN|nr:hypothetical protein Air01nite_72120 [Asanoa iriomotensis]